MACSLPQKSVFRNSVNFDSGSAATEFKKAMGVKLMQPVMLRVKASVLDTYRIANLLIPYERSVSSVPNAVNKEFIS